jgi:hypothetical protein
LGISYWAWISSPNPLLFLYLESFFQLAEPIQFRNAIFKEKSYVQLNPLFERVRIISGYKDNETKLNVTFENQTSIVFDRLSDENFISYIDENKPDIVIIYSENQQDRNTLTPLRDMISQYSNQTVIGIIDPCHCYNNIWGLCNCRHP